jgi:hypothetical protein
VELVILTDDGLPEGKPISPEAVLSPSIDRSRAVD